MSLPGDALQGTATPSSVLFPDSLGKSRSTVDYERGGVAINDASQGLNHAVWRVRLSGAEDIAIGAEPYTSETVLFTQTGVKELSLAFDQLMRPMVAYMTGGGSFLRWYDPVLSAVDIMSLGADVRSPRLTMDDKRAIASASNDVLLFYLQGNALKYRQQRERFAVVRTLKVLSNTTGRIKRAGMNDGLRMQIEIEGAVEA